MLKRINILLGTAFFPVSFKILTFIAFLGLVFTGLSASPEHPVLARYIYRTNLTTVFIWDIWWPLIILSAIIFGRVWCMVCPIEMITAFFARIGFRRERPRWLLSGWIITLFFSVIVIVGVTILMIDFNPKHTVWYLLIIASVSVLSGIIFEKNTFCGYICPVGYLLGIFSKMSSWGWRVKNKMTCKTCPDKSCISSRYLYQQNYKSCGVDLVPSEISDNNNCILCAGCLKTCKKYRTDSNTERPNPALVKTGFASDLMQIRPVRFVEWVFLFFMTAHLIDEITEFQSISMFREFIFPGNISGLLGIEEGLAKDLISAGNLFFFLSVILWIVPFLFLLASGRIRISLADYLNHYSLVFLPVITGLFVGLIIMEITVRIPYYQYLISDPIGIRTLQGILTRQIVLAQFPEWTDWVFFCILMLCVIAGIIISYRVVSKYASKFNVQKGKTTLFGSVILFVLMFFAVVILFDGF